VLKRALPPALLLLSACTSPEAQPPPSAPPAARASEPTAPVIDRKSGPPAEVAQPVASAPDSKPPVIDRKPMPPASAADEASPQVAEATRALFIANCAQCHGEKGDGEGVTQLDRKARSFLEGGFSYGNTKDAILRSITHGIPGTPMPSFEKALDEAQRTALASYVIAFGPDQIVVDPSESEMVVKDRPLVVRGKLPPIVEGAKEWARGLAIGTTDGLTFEYRTDDVQLVGVRAGRFVNRSDWGERGGTALVMLGKVVDDISDHRAQLFSLPGSPDAATQCRLRATDGHAKSATLTYDVTTKSSDRREIVIATVEETPAAYQGEKLSGYKRTFRIRARESVARLHFAPALRSSTHGPWARTDKAVLVWCRDERMGHVEAPDGTRDLIKGPLVVVRTSRDSAKGAWSGGGHVGFDFEIVEGDRVTVEVFTIPNPPTEFFDQTAIVAEFGQL